MTWTADGSTTYTPAITTGSWTTVSTGLADKVVVLSVGAVETSTYTVREKGESASFGFGSGSYAVGCSSGRGTTTVRTTLITRTDGSGDFEITASTSHTASVIVLGSLDSTTQSETVYDDATIGTTWETKTITAAGSAHALVLLRIEETYGSSNRQVWIRPGDLTDADWETRNYTTLSCSGVYLDGNQAAYVLMPTDSSGQVQFRCVNASIEWTIDVICTVDDWTASRSDIHDATPAAAATWTDVSTGLAAKSFLALGSGPSSTAETLVIATRENGDTAQYYDTSASVYGAARCKVEDSTVDTLRGITYTGCDASGTIEAIWQSNSNDQTIELLGYVTSTTPPDAVLFVPESPRGYPDAEAASIRAPATNVGFGQHLIDRINWLLAARQGVIFEGTYDGAITTLSEGRVYHNPSTNCERVVVVAQYEGATNSGASVSLIPSDAAGTEVKIEPTYVSGATTRWGVPSWAAMYRAATLENQSEQYHKLSWTNVKVRHIAVLELPRDYLKTADGDTAQRPRGVNRSGLDAGRYITESTDAGVDSLLQNLESARDNTKRHLGGVIFDDSNAWSKISSGAWANIADGSLGTSGFGFRHQARLVRAATTTVDYVVRIRARATGTGTGDFRVRSAGTGDAAAFTSLTSSWAWYTPDDDTFTVDATADDTLIPEAYTSDGTTTVEVSQIQIYEA